MASKATSARLLKLLFNLCFGILFFEVLAVVEWFVAMTMMPRSPMAHLAPLLAVLLGTQVVGLACYFWKPWVTVVAAWMGILLIVARAIPWGSASWFSAARQFEFQIIFLLVAHAGFALKVLMNRAEAGIVPEIVSGSMELPAAEKEATEPASVDPQAPLS